MKKILAVALALSCCIASEAKATAQQTGINSQSTIPARDFLIKNVTLCSAQTAPGVCATIINNYGWAAHTFQIITTGSPTYSVTVSGCYDSACATAPVVLAATGSVATTPLNLAAGGIYPFIQVNVATLSTGSITVQQISTSDQAYGDANGRDIIGNSNRVSYSTSFTVTVPTSAGALATIEADGTNKLRLRYMKVCLTTGIQTAGGERQLILYRTTVASSGGSSVTPTILDSSADPAFGGVLRTGGITTTPTGGSVTVANSLWSGVIFMPGAVTTAVPCIEKHFDLGQLKAPTTAAATTASGLAIADLTGGSGGTGNYAIDLEWTAEPN